MKKTLFLILLALLSVFMVSCNNENEKEEGIVPEVDENGERKIVYDKENIVLEDTVMTNDEVKQYIENHPDFEVIGDCSYIEISSKKPNILEGLLSFKDVVKPVEDVLSVKPLYLKD